MANNERPPAGELPVWPSKVILQPIVFAHPHRYQANQINTPKVT